MEQQWLTAHAPGRINIIGEHIDYNSGFVLPAAIDKVTTFKLRPNGTSTARFQANNVNESYAFDLNNFEPIKGNWQNYVMGVVSELQKLGVKIHGFDAEFNGNVPIGSGMSSSAALECSLAEGLNQLFDLQLDHWQIIKACQMAEHNFVGIKCGIMDQFASVMGREKQAMLLDCDSLDYEYIPLELGEHSLILFNTNVSHQLASSEYNKRRSACEQGLAELKEQNPEIQNFRQVQLSQIESAKENLGTKVYNRCQHVVTETQRVLKAVEALRQQNLAALGKLMYQSHHSLRHHYEVSCPELDFLVDQCSDNNYTTGSRMMGGGFGGCTINLVEKQKAQSVIQILGASYAKQFSKELSVYPVNIGAGARVS